jgi:disulfide oxidoreductase YuzD
MGSLGLKKTTTYPSVLINDNIIGQGNISRTDHGSIDIMDITTTKCTDVLLTAYI